jgi:hypothetical protein
MQYSEEKEEVMSRAWRGRMAVVLLGLLVVLTVVPVAWALGPSAPPVVTNPWVNVRVNDDAAARLFVEVFVEVPGGRVPQNISSVTVLVPGESTPRNIPRGLGGDLQSDNYFQSDLTSAGVVGFPLGTYTFTVTDTAGGVTTGTDTLTSNSPLLAPVITSHTADQLILPIPQTITWNPVSGAAQYRVRMRYGLFDANLFSMVTTGTSLTLPSGVIVPGRRYQIRLEALDNASTNILASNAQAVRRIQVEAQGPDVFLTFPSQAYGAGQTLDITARVWNTHPAAVVNAVVWIGLPGGGASMRVLEFKNVMLPQGMDWTGSLGFSYTFTGGEPSGAYVVGFRLSDPASDETIALVTRTFSK